MTINSDTHQRSDTHDIITEQYVVPKFDLVAKCQEVSKEYLKRMWHVACRQSRTSSGHQVLSDFGLSYVYCWCRLSEMFSRLWISNIPWYSCSTCSRFMFSDVSEMYMVFHDIFIGYRLNMVKYARPRSLSGTADRAYVIRYYYNML